MEPRADLSEADGAAAPLEKKFFSVIYRQKSRPHPLKIRLNPTIAPLKNNPGSATAWNVVCDRVLSRPKLSSACSFNHSLQDAVKEVVDKVLSEPIRPHFAIASIGGYYYEDGFDLGDACRLFTAALGTDVPVIVNRPCGVMGRDAFSNGFKEIDWYCYLDEIDVIMLIVGFLPGMKVKTIPLLKQVQEPDTVMIDEFVTDIREFSTSVSGWNSPAAIIMFSGYYACREDVLKRLNNTMSPETVIVGDTFSPFRFTNDGISAAVALVFAVDMNKPPGIGETQFHAVLSSRWSPVGPTYKAKFVWVQNKTTTNITARREGSDENIDGASILNQVYDELGDQTRSRDLYIGVTKERQYYIDQEFGCMTSLAFHRVWGSSLGYLVVNGGDIETGDTFCLYYSDSTNSRPSAAAVSAHLKSFNQGSNNTSGGDKLEVFGGLIFSCPDMFGEPEISSSPFLDNFPGVTLGGNFCSGVIGRRVVAPFVKESQEQKLAQCLVHIFCNVYLVMSYAAPRI